MREGCAASGRNVAAADVEEEVKLRDDDENDDCWNGGEYDVFGVRGRRWLMVMRNMRRQQMQMQMMPQSVTVAAVLTLMMFVFDSSV